MFKPSRLSRRSFSALMAGTAAFALGSPVLLAQEAPMGDGSTIRLLSNPAGTQSYPPFVIQEFGLDEKYGFTLEVVPSTTTQATTAAIQAGGAELGIFDWTTIARMRNANVGVIGVAPFLTYINSIVVPIDSELEELSDLVGHTLGIFSATSFDWIVFRAYGQRVLGIDFDTALQTQEAAAPLLRGSIEQGQLDATFMFNSIAPDMLASGNFRTLAPVSQIVDELGLPTMPYLIYAAREDYAEANPDNIRAFVAAYQEAVDILLENDEVWDTQGANQGLVPEAIVEFRDQVRGDIVKYFDEDTEATLRETFDIVLETGGPEALGMETLPDEIITLEYQ